MNIEELSQVALFSGLAPDELEFVVQQSIDKEYPKNYVLLSEGEHSDALYILLSGRAKVFASDSEGKEIVLAILSPLDYFGEFALVDGQPRSASVITMETSRVARISSDDFRGILEKYPDLAFQLITQLVHKMRRQTEGIKTLALMDVYGRVAKTLLDQSRDQDGEMVLTGLTQAEIANMVGASREMVSRILKDLRLGGYISVEEKRIVINEPPPAKY